MFILNHIEHWGHKELFFNKKLRVLCELCGSKNIYEMKITKSYINNLAYKIVGAAIEVHRILGPGLLESIYEECLFHELKLRGLSPERQVPVSIIYKGIKVKDDLHIDLLVNKLVIVELKSVNEMPPIYQAQIISYMDLSEIPKGLLINFNVVRLIDGVTHFVNDIFADLPD